jgi:type VI secretion system protein ImpF
MSVEDLKDAVARDLEALLNTRAVIDEELLKDYPECSRSIVSYGLSDFADRSLSSPSDRAHICACLERSSPATSRACATSRPRSKCAKAP